MWLRYFLALTAFAGCAGAFKQTNESDPEARCLADARTEMYLSQDYGQAKAVLHECRSDAGLE